MATPAYALNDALQKLLAQPTGDRGYEPKPFVAVLWQFLAAVSESPGGIDVLRKHGTLVASRTALGSAYHKAVEAAKALVDEITSTSPQRLPEAPPQPTSSFAGRANTAKLFPHGVPENSDIVDLVVRLDAGKSSEKSKNQIAREFTGEIEGEDSKAKSLLSQIRRLQRSGRITL